MAGSDGCASTWIPWTRPAWASTRRSAWRRGPADDPRRRCDRAARPASGAAADGAWAAGLDGVEVVAGDLRRPETLPAALDGVRTVVAAAQGFGGMDAAGVRAVD